MPFPGLCLENKGGPSCSHIALGEEQLLPARPWLNKSSNCLQDSAIRDSLPLLLSLSQKGEREIEKKKKNGERSHPKPYDLPSPSYPVCLKMLLTRRGHGDSHLPL